MRNSITMKIPWAKPLFLGKEKEYVSQAMASTWISGGPFIQRFEKNFASLHQMPFGLAVSNGTTALQLALLSLGIGAGDEVILPGFTFVAPVNMSIAVGATPVYADVDPKTWCLDPDSVSKCVTAKTKAIVAVHIYGNVCDMDALRQIANSRGIFLIEDNAEAMFSKYRGRYAGTLGDAGCFSFQATKTITMGEGGFLMTSKADVYERARVIRDHGMRPDKRYWHDVIGYNFRLTNLQAALGCAQLEGFRKIIAGRERFFSLYRRYLADVPGVRFQVFSKEVSPVVWAVGIKIDQAYFKKKRDSIMGALAQEGIETRPGFYPIAEMPLYQASSLPVSSDLGKNVICLPSFPSLTEEEIIYIVQKIKRLLEH